MISTFRKKRVSLDCSDASPLRGTFLKPCGGFHKSFTDHYLSTHSHRLPLRKLRPAKDELDPHDDIGPDEDILATA